MKISRIGFGQVEPNHLSAQRTGQIYGQLPCNKDIKVLENGQYVKYDYANNEVNYTGEGEWMLVFNEVKLYEDMWRETYRDFALQAKNMVDGIITPRLFKTNIGDIYTTNCIGTANTQYETTTEVELVEGDMLKVDATGYLVKGEDEDMQWQVVKCYTMPDGQPAVKIMRVK